MTVSTPVQRTAFTTVDPDVAREFIDRAYGARLTVRQPRESAARCSIDQIETDQFTWADVQLPFDTTFEQSGTGEYTFTVLLGGTVERCRDGAVQRFGRGDTYLAIEPDDAYPGRSAAVHARTIRLPPTLLDEVARGDTDVPARAWRFTSPRPVPGGARRWSRTVALAESVLADAEASATSLLLGPVTRLLAATALTVFPNTALTRPAPVIRRGGRPVALRRAIACIEASPDRDLSIGEIARVAGVSPRAVQLAFRRHLDTTPTAYMRRVRLEQARHRLLNATPEDGLTVTRVALDWGFANPGRFARAYRAAYGELPSQTLAR
jgi:AraC-like DNA-binding protein